MANDITWNPNDKGSLVILSDNDMTASLGSLHAVRATEGRSDGKWYWEIEIIEALIPPSVISIGIDDGTEIVNGHGTLTGNNKQRGYANNGQKYGPLRTSYSDTSSNGDIIGVLLDLVNGELSFTKNGVSLGVAWSDLEKMNFPVYPRIGSWSSSGAKKATVNFGAAPFKYPIPEGYKPYQVEPHKLLIFSNNEAYTHDGTDWVNLGALPYDKKELFEQHGMEEITSDQLKQLKSALPTSKFKVIGMSEE